MNVWLGPSPFDVFYYNSVNPYGVNRYCLLSVKKKKFLLKSFCLKTKQNQVARNTASKPRHPKRRCPFVGEKKKLSLTSKNPTPHTASQPQHPSSIKKMCV
jgi:hypothetical protein